MACLSFGTVLEDKVKQTGVAERILRADTMLFGSGWLPCPPLSAGQIGLFRIMH
jgi:hypothetical protein